MMIGRPRVSNVGSISDQCCGRPAYLQCVIAVTTCLNPDVIHAVIIQEDYLETSE